MKIGDTISVTMAGFEVAEGIIEDIADDKATIFIPATRVIMGVAHSLTDLEPEIDRRLDGMVRDNDTTSAASQEVNNRITNDDIGEGNLRNRNFDSSAID
jgi:hypothetical protein